MIIIILEECEEVMEVGSWLVLSHQERIMRERRNRVGA